MKRLLLAALAVCVMACGGRPGKDETPVRGHAAVLVDETLFPMIEGQAEVFMSHYPYATLNLLRCQDHEVSALMRRDSLRIAVLARDLTPGEQAWFESKTLIPHITEVAYDAIALVVNRDMTDSLISESALRDMLAGRPGASKFTLVFDNPASSTVSYMKGFSGTDSLPGAYSAGSHRELLEYVAAHNNAIGFTGVDWLYEADSSQRQYIDRIKVLAVGEPATGYYKPTQSDIAAGKYPFTRKVKLINCQGTAGLGVGFASFLAGDAGQRIVLKSGLVPVAYPKREIVVRKDL